MITSFKAWWISMRVYWRTRRSKMEGHVTYECFRWPGCNWIDANWRERGMCQQMRFPEKNWKRAQAIVEKLGAHR